MGDCQYVMFLAEVYGYSHSCCRDQLILKVFTVRYYIILKQENMPEFELFLN